MLIVLVHLCCSSFFVSPRESDINELLNFVKYICSFFLNVFLFWITYKYTIHYPFSYRHNQNFNQFDYNLFNYLTFIFTIDTKANSQVEIMHYLIFWLIYMLCMVHNWQKYHQVHLDFYYNIWAKRCHLVVWLPIYVISLLLTQPILEGLVCFGLNSPLRQYFSLYWAISQREGERKEKG